MGTPAGTSTYRGAESQTRLRTQAFPAPRLAQRGWSWAPGSAALALAVDTLPAYSRCRWSFRVLVVNAVVVARLPAPPSTGEPLAVAAHRLAVFADRRSYW